MKLYLFAPIAIAGFTAAIGAVSIANTELGLFKSGQAVVAILKNQDQKPQSDDAMQLKFALDGDRAGNQASPAEMDFGRVASNDPMPTPQISTEVAPLECESSEAPRAAARHARRTAPRLPRAARTIELAPTAPTAPTLTSYHFKDSDGMRFVVKGDENTPMVSLAGLPAECPKISFTFDGKKFEADTKRFEAQKMKIASVMAKKHATQWQVFTEQDLKALKSFAMAAEFKAFDENGTPHVIKIDPAKIAADAEHKAACDAKEVDLDNDDQEIISGAQSK
jgi:hypothetical protein